MKRVQVLFMALSPAVVLLSFILVVVVTSVALRLLRWKRRVPVIAFLHPYCASGGGGERVLWVGIAAICALVEKSKARVVVYTGDRDVSVGEMRAKALSRFGVEVGSFELVYVRTRPLVEAWLWPVATLAGQSFGSTILALECLLRLPPDLMIETTGLAFSYPVAKLFCGCSVAAYVHYPTISRDMIAAVESRRAAFNNRTLWARSELLTKAKLGYYRAFTAAYGAAGRLADVVACNSTWTKGHICDIWEREDPIIVYPPCDTETLCCESVTEAADEDATKTTALSLAQFRPEKNHQLQLEAWALLPEDVRKSARLVVAGAVRHSEDELLLRRLQKEADRLGLENVTFLVGAPRTQIVELMSKAQIGLHTMRLEHFGIAVVEMMAARVVPIAHKSGGPLLDIVGDSGDRGLLADTLEEYAEAITTLIRDANLRRRMAENARNFVQARFSDASFSRAFVHAYAPLIENLKQKKVVQGTLLVP